MILVSVLNAVSHDTCGEESASFKSLTVGAVVIVISMDTPATTAAINPAVKRFKSSP